MKRLLLALVLLLAACAPQAPRLGGIIEAKWDRPPFTYLMMMPISCGKNCTSYMYIPITEPHRCYFQIRKQTWEVDCGVWNNYAIGEKYGVEYTDRLVR